MAKKPPKKTRQQEDRNVEVQEEKSEKAEKKREDLL